MKEKTKAAENSENWLLDFLLHHWHSLRLGVLESIGCASKITEHIMSSVMQKNIFHLCEKQKTSVTSHIKYVQIISSDNLNLSKVHCLQGDQFDLPWDLDGWLDFYTGGDKRVLHMCHKISVTPRPQKNLSVNAGSSGSPPVHLYKTIRSTSGFSIHKLNKLLFYLS